MKLIKHVFLWSFIIRTSETFARAGYSGGGRGYSGGGYRGGYYGTHGSGSWDDSSPIFWLSLVAFPILAVLVTLIMFWSKNRSIVKNGQRAKELLKKASLKDDFWNELRLKKQVKFFFIDLQKEWTTNNLSVLRKRVSPHCFQKLSNELIKMKRKRVYNFISNISFDNIEIIGVRDYKKNDNDSFSVLIEGRMIDEILKEGHRSNTLKKKEFTDIYEFRRDGSQIILYRILPYKAVYDGVIKNLKE